MGSNNSKSSKESDISENKIKTIKQAEDNKIVESKSIENKEMNQKIADTEFKIIEMTIEDSQNPNTQIRKSRVSTVGGSLLQDIRQTYKFKEVLGGGHFGTVRTAYKKLDLEKHLYAVKSISKKKLSESDLQILTQEVEIISTLDHPNIIKLYETYHDEYYFHIVMELCTGKEVFEKIIEERQINEYKVANIIYKLLSAINYCHSKNISHRDIKPENILFETSDPDSEIKLIDFGLSKKYDTDQKMHTILGTPYYVAPEVLKGDYTEKCDVWSLGAITYIMLSGEPPFNGNSNHEIFNRIMNSEVSFEKRKWKQVSKECIDFISKCLNKNPECRFTAYEASEHPWFKNILNEIHASKNLSSEILENLKNFSSPSRFKKLVLRFLINQLSRKEIKKLRDAFYAIDLDNKGQININELEKAFNLAGVNASPIELKKIIESNENHKSGVIDYTEFLVASISQKKFVDKEKLISAFNYFDIDGSGYICTSDLKNVLLRSGKKVLKDEDIESMLVEVTNMKDENKISLSEFLGLFNFK